MKIVANNTSNKQALHTPDCMYVQQMSDPREATEWELENRDECSNCHDTAFSPVLDCLKVRQMLLAGGTCESVANVLDAKTSHVNYHTGHCDCDTDVQIKFNGTEWVEK